MESALQNTIKKYKNFEITLPDGTQKSFAMIKMGRGDTDAVMQAFERRMHELADALGTVEDGEREKHLQRTYHQQTLSNDGPGPNNATI